MNNCKLSDLIQIVQSFCEERDWDQFHNPKDLAIGISTEGNELLDLFRFKNEDEMRQMLNDPDKREMISDELADVFFFVLRFAQMNGIDLEGAFQNKVRKNSEKYPVEKSRGNNHKYNE